MVTTAHPNPCIIPTPTPHLTPPLGHIHHHGQSKDQNKTKTNTTMAPTPRLTPLRDDDPHLGPSYQLPPPSSPSPTPVPHPGPSYAATAVTKATPLSHPHLLPALHHGRLYPAGSNQLHKTAGTLNNESRRNPESFWMKFPFSFICLLLSLTLIIQIFAHYHTPTSPHHYLHSLLATPTTTLLCF